MKLLPLSILFCFALNLYAADTVRINDAANLLVTGSLPPAIITLGSDAPSGDATAETAPAKVYIPIQTALVNELNYSIFKKRDGVVTLFDITNPTHQVTYPLLITANVTGNNKMVYAAVKPPNSTSYYIVAQSTAITSSVSNSYLAFNLSVQDICKPQIANSISGACTTLGAFLPASTVGARISSMVYFYIADEGAPTLGSTAIVPTSATSNGGVFFEAQMTNQPPNTTIVSMSDLRKGDARLIGTFSSSPLMEPLIFKKVVVYQYIDTATPVAANIPIGLASAGTILNNDVASTQSGEFTLNGLTNAKPYKISIALQDKFLFTTGLTASLKGTPTEIQELLKKQACYLLTAGFGEEHYVITFFRHYRDQVLANTWIGSQFIRIYYKTAPHYALIIYQSEWMRFSIRAAAYALYFFFNYSWLVLIFLLPCFYLDFQKKKSLLHNNRL